MSVKVVFIETLLTNVLPANPESISAFPESAACAIAPFRILFCRASERTVVACCNSSKTPEYACYRP